MDGADSHGARSNRIRTHYDNLKVSRDAPIEVIQAAYDSLVAKYHPDLHPGGQPAARILGIINASYEVLSDAAKRLQYDRWIASVESDTPASKRDPDAMSGLDRFLALCHSIRLNCWQMIQNDEASREHAVSH